MPIIITRKSPIPQSAADALKWALEAASDALAYLKALVELDANVRNIRTKNAERAQSFVSAVVTNAAVLALQTLEPLVLTELDYTTALIATDAGSGPARWRIDGGDPLAAATAAAGMPLAAGQSLTLVGARNIADFRVIAEAANVNVSITLFK